MNTIADATAYCSCRLTSRVKFQLSVLSRFVLYAILGAQEQCTLQEVGHSGIVIFCIPPGTLTVKGINRRMQENGDFFSCIFMV